MNNPPCIYHAVTPGQSLVITALDDDDAQDRLDEYLHERGLDSVPVQRIWGIGFGVECFPIPAKQRKRAEAQAQK